MNDNKKKEVKLIDFVGFVNKFREAKDLEMPSWLDILKDSIARVCIWLFVGIIGYDIISGLGIGSFYRYIPLLIVGGITLYKIFINVKWLMIVNLYSFEESLNDELSSMGFNLSIEKLDSLVYLVRKDIVNRKSKSIKIFKYSTRGIKEGTEISFIVNIALNRYLNEKDSLEDDYSIEFNNWYRTLKLDLDKVFKLNSI